ncbi:hypothetical protein HWD35_16945 [Tsukamurella tyrosinosolvens]|uniref:hypothetical protein n=1 Tax=Tsukamurella tyrosinosolvens TaxID=57704 RepID=UPI0007937B66|nr:hypothetical protein [Tsukamurella tyrosinosolvens]KXP02382.1 hypothetical protein AXK59_17745 [Tsukamurella tyrosinosolvens]KZL96520.1 hypothetical protein AXX05_13380 [Tsukamurella tyrosinosolvens]MCA4996408.1 hypothetical protein [Tsukamurella tyrosinosolvens]WEL93777.1 hypothetical protein P1N98_02375 [Tsukamurella tyrosinosolvens]
MSARTVSTRRTATTVAGALLAAGALLSVSACGAGQISQTANQVAAINGANQTFVDQKIALSDVHVLFPVSGSQGKLAFVLTNLNPHQADKLKGISDEKGRFATISGDTTLAANGSLYGTAPAGSDTKAAGITRLTVSVPVDANWRPGLTNKLWFHLEKAGSLPIDVPIDAGAAPASVAGITPTAGEHGAGEGTGGH